MKISRLSMKISRLSMKISRLVTKISRLVTKIGPEKRKKTLRVIKIIYKPTQKLSE